MGDRVLEVKIPQSKAAGFYDMVGGSASGSRLLSRRIHVGNVTERVTRKDLEDYFGKFGTITDIFVPKPTEVRLRGAQDT
jgi:RNA recognition motif-containing protein